MFQRTLRSWLGCAGLLAAVASDARAAVPIGGEFQVFPPNYDYVAVPFVASSDDGAFVVVWAGSELFGQRFDSSGVKLGGAFQINTRTIGYQLYPKIAADADVTSSWLGRMARTPAPRSSRSGFLRQELASGPTSWSTPSPPGRTCPGLRWTPTATSW
jgi:hypothetical protein